MAHHAAAVAQVTANAAGAKNVKFKAEDFVLEFRQPVATMVEGDATSANDLDALLQMFGIK
jgi:hypothetical protein